MKRKGILVVFLAVFSVLCMTACGMKPEEASAYVKSALDASYKGEFDDYVEITNSTMEEAEKMYQTNLDNAMTGAGFTEAQGLSEELEAKYRELFAKMLSLANYEMSEVAKSEDGFEITVSYARYLGLDGLEDEVKKAIHPELEGMVKLPEDAELSKMIYEKMYDLLKERVDHPTFGDEGTTLIHVTRGEDGVYSISDEDIKKLDKLMFEGEK